MSIPFKPAFARVLLERPLIEKSSGGIIIPEVAQKRNAETKGVVIAVGPNCDDQVKEMLGKTVLFAKFAGDWLKIADKEYYICQDEDILGVENGK